MPRTVPFNGFSRGLPIVGQRQETPPAGAYYYHVPVLIQREGHPLEADSYEINLSTSLEGVRFLTLANQIADALKEKAPELSRPKVIPLAPFFLGFIPQDALDRAEAQLKAQAEERS